VSALAKAIAGNASNALEIARRLETYLRTNYRYTLQLPGETSDPLVDFLLVTREGHCEQFATALTIMLRTLNIPSRLVAGFYGGERLRNRYALRAADAHTWTEAILPEGAIVLLDGTPESSRAARSRAFLDQLLSFYESLNERWRTAVLDYSFQDQAAVARHFAPLLNASRRWIRRLPLLFALAGLCIWYLRRISLSLKRHPRHQATELAERALKLLASKGILKSGESMEDLTKRLQGNKHPMRAPVAKVARRYLEARFGARPLASGERDALLRHLARAARQRAAIGARTRGD
jgi:hypothetical protein